MIIGIVIGAFFVICLIVAFAAGYGFADQKYKTQDTEEE